MIRLAVIPLSALALLGTGCRRESAEVSRTLGFDAFLPVYNRYIQDWLQYPAGCHRQGTRPHRCRTRDSRWQRAKQSLRNPVPRRSAAIRKNGTSASPSATILKIGNPADIPRRPRLGKRHGPTGDRRSRREKRRRLPPLHPVLSADHPALRRQFQQLLPRRSLRLHRHAAGHPPSGNHGDDPRTRQRVGGLRRRPHDLFPDRSRGALLGRRARPAPGISWSASISASPTTSSIPTPSSSTGKTSPRSRCMTTSPSRSPCPRRKSTRRSSPAR